MAKSSAPLRIPTLDEYRAFDGMNCKDIWKKTPDSWRCPGCDRSKFELMRWGKRTGGNAMRYGEIGWKAAIHKHHDHSGGWFGTGCRWEGLIPICGDCNSTDGRVKRQLDLPSDWSFHPSEIRAFAKMKPHGAVDSVDLDAAYEIYIDAAYEIYIDAVTAS